MSFIYTPHLIETSLTYAGYRKSIDAQLAALPDNETAAKMKPHIERNAGIMDKYDTSTSINDSLILALATAPKTTWLVITEDWCGDAGFIVPVIAAIEKAVPEKVQLRLALRDSNLDLIDANLTDGGRAIPILVVLDESLQPIAKWGPRPAELQVLVKKWKANGSELKDLIMNVNAWYNTDDTQKIQEEIAALVLSYV